MKRAIIALAWSVAHLACEPMLPAQGEPNSCQPLGATTQADVPKDNVRASFVNHEVGLLAPLAVQGPVLSTVNQPGSQLSVSWLQRFGVESPSGFRHDLVLKGGPGAASVAFRPGTWENWVVDRVTGTVQVFDLIGQVLAHSIQVGPEPHGIQFSDNGDRAWITCSGDDSVAVIDIRSGSPTRFQVVNRIALPSREPRGITKIGNRVFVACLLSGNNTTTRSVGGELADSQIARVIPSEGATQELPDEDLHVIAVHPTDPLADALLPAEAYRGLGTIIFNVHRRPGTSELWLPNTDALNADFVGEKNFVAGQVVRNRITVVNTATRAVNIIDLDALAPSGVSFAQPTSVAFDPDRGQAFVTCYGGDVVAVLTLSGSLDRVIPIPSSGTWRSGPRFATVSGNQLFVVAKNDNAITVVDLEAADAASGPYPMGYDPTPLVLRRGRGHLINGEHSLSGTSSCASCHIDGHWDGLVWDLSQYLDPEGTATPQFAVDHKGPMATQSLRGLREALPYHWRGEKRTLADFNGAFPGLLERSGGPLAAPEMADLVAYMESLVYPANPRQDFFRDYRPDELLGADAYMNDPAGNCNTCHALPLGTQNELMMDVFAGPSRAFKVTQLRGVADKVLQPTIFVGGAFGRFGTVNRNGTGLLHSGTLPSVFDFLDHIFGMEPCRETAVEKFLIALDTGLAPSTAFQATLNQDNATTFTAHLDLMAAADRGDCDLYVIGTIRFPELVDPVQVDGLYVPGSGEMELTYASLGRFPVSLLPGYAAAGVGSWTFIGGPLGTGARFGLDLDYDGVRDDDEVFQGLDSENPDWDEDGFSDGHELAHAMNPLVADIGSLDQTPPQILSADPVFSTTNVTKLVVTTDEPCHVKATWTSVDGPQEVSSVVTSNGILSASHDLILQGLPVGQATPVTLVATDEGGNSSPTWMVTATTLGNAISGASHIASMTLDVVSATSATSGLQVEASAVVMSRQDLPLADQTVFAAAYLELDGVLQALTWSEATVSDANGRARWVWELPDVVSGAAVRRVHFSVFWVDGSASPPGSVVPAYIEGEDKVNAMSVGF